MRSVVWEYLLYSMMMMIMMMIMMMMMMMINISFKAYIFHEPTYYENHISVGNWYIIKNLLSF